MSTRWDALVLAAGRGPDDPMAQAYGVPRKCMIEVGGEPMLHRVIRTLRGHAGISRVAVSIEDDGPLGGRADFVRSGTSAPGSAIEAIAAGAVRFPVLVTTADHPLLTGRMISHFLDAAAANGADLSVGLATAETILLAYPKAKRTFLTFGKDRVSGCNLFALMNADALKALRAWALLDQVRKKPWKLVRAFGAGALIRFATGRLSLEQAFVIASRRLGLVAKPVLLPFAEAAIDVDKPEDKELADIILSRR